MASLRVHSRLPRALRDKIARDDILLVPSELSGAWRARMPVKERAMRLKRTQDALQARDQAAVPLGDSLSGR